MANVEKTEIGVIMADCVQTDAMLLNVDIYARIVLCELSYK